jgi:hypothetical protein
MPTFDYTSGDWNIVRNAHPVAPNVEVLRVMNTGPIQGDVVPRTMIAPGYLVLMRYDPDIGHHAGDWYLAGYNDRIYEPGQGK